MSNTSEQPWSNNPNAPQIPSPLYTEEKDDFAGLVIGTMLYGIVITLFFQCMSVLLRPVNSIRGGIKWGLVAHAVAMFSFLTISFGIYLNAKSISYINNRDFPGNDDSPPGPIGYELLLYTRADVIVYEVLFPLNQWLADGLLLHRCYVIYSMKYWVMAFPCLMYLATIAIGAAYIYQQSDPRVATPSLGAPYYSISLALNVLLTLMIVTRLVLHIRNVRRAIGASDTSSRLSATSATVVTMLIESYALYAVVLLIYIVSSVAENWIAGIFSKALGPIQVIAPYLIILRVANRRALTSESIIGTAESLRFGGQETTDSDGSLVYGDLMNSTEVNSEALGELGAGAEDAVEEVPL